jgi:hypothetical protein
MAKRERFFPDKQVTIQVNEVVLEYLEDLAKTGVYGNTYPEAAEAVFRHGLKNLIESGILKSKERPFKDGEE